MDGCSIFRLASRISSVPRSLLIGLEEMCAAELFPSDVILRIALDMRSFRDGILRVLTDLKFRYDESAAQGKARSSREPHS